MQAAKAAKWKVVNTDTGRAWLWNFRSVARAQYRIDNCTRPELKGKLKVVPQV